VSPEAGEVKERSKAGGESGQSQRRQFWKKEDWRRKPKEGELGIKGYVGEKKREKGGPKLGKKKRRHDQKGGRVQGNA